MKPKGYWKDKDNFVKESKSIHGDKFTYDILIEAEVSEFKGVMLECFLLEKFRKYKVTPNCKFEGYTECFRILTDYMISLIERYTNEQLQR